MKIRHLLYVFLAALLFAAPVPGRADTASATCEPYMNGPFVEAECANYDEAAIWQNGQNQEGHDCLSPHWFQGSWRVLCLE